MAALGDGFVVEEFFEACGDLSRLFEAFLGHQAVNGNPAGLDHVADMMFVHFGIICACDFV